MNAATDRPCNIVSYDQAKEANPFFNYVEDKIQLTAMIALVVARYRSRRLFNSGSERRRLQKMLTLYPPKLEVREEAQRHGKRDARSHGKDTTLERLYMECGNRAPQPEASAMEYYLRSSLVVDQVSVCASQTSHNIPNFLSLVYIATRKLKEQR
ncbi:unnamed protein product [Sphenostylis stenocarpa]|uniref:Uncharacterized protein n=1 Tax=Sphenostylis stenocarpa TaxID=92480 RepID=A0AA86W5W7_9FABA|nr:unnamed protein product [Sphenostylis stenocarpa]